MNRRPYTTPTLVELGRVEGLRRWIAAGWSLGYLVALFGAMLCALCAASCSSASFDTGRADFNDGGAPLDMGDALGPYDTDVGPEVEQLDAGDVGTEVEQLDAGDVGPEVDAGPRCDPSKVACCAPPKAVPPHCCAAPDLAARAACAELLGRTVATVAVYVCAPGDTFDTSGCVLQWSGASGKQWCCP